MQLHTHREESGHKPQIQVQIPWFHPELKFLSMSSSFHSHGFPPGSSSFSYLPKACWTLNWPLGENVCVINRHNIPGWPAPAFPRSCSPDPDQDKTLTKDEKNHCVWAHACFELFVFCDWHPVTIHKRVTWEEKWLFLTFGSIRTHEPALLRPMDYLNLKTQSSLDKKAGNMLHYVIVSYCMCLILTEFWHCYGNSGRKFPVPFILQKMDLFFFFRKFLSAPWLLLAP